jgi:isopentenyl-diphosphate delta-isomerase
LSTHAEVILVTEQDEVIGKMEKLEAHQKGVLHRAFSVLVFNDQHEMLLQRRAFGKYHSEGLWTNTCCSHPMPGESILEAAHRRLLEEMHLECPLEPAFHFLYHAELDNQLIEHELDHVVIGYTNETPHLNTEEAIAFRWMSLDAISEDMEEHPDKYTYWFKLIMHNYSEQLHEKIAHLIPVKTHIHQKNK